MCYHTCLGGDDASQHSRQLHVLWKHTVQLREACKAWRYRPAEAEGTGAVGSCAGSFSNQTRNQPSGNREGQGLP